MGFSTLDGIPMATRCGALDAGVLLHLLGPLGRSPAEISDTLYHKSGLLGISGISADARELLASDRLEARQAIEAFTFRIAGEDRAFGSDARRSRRCRLYRRYR